MTKKTALLTLVIFGLLTPFSVKAASNVKVDVSNNAEGSHNSVKVNSNSSVSQSNTSNVKTDIRIESNGEVKEYHSDKPEDVSISSNDGNSSVHINNQQSSNPTPTVTQSPTKSSVKVNVKTDGTHTEVNEPTAPPTPTPPPSPDVLGIKTEDKHLDLMKLLKEILSSIRFRL